MASALIERVLERPRGQKIAILIGSFALLLFFYWQYFASPMVEELERLDREQTTLKSQIYTEEKTIRNLPKFRAEVKNFESLRQLALNQLPYKRDMDSLLSSVTALAKDSGLNVLRFAPGEEQIKDLYAELPIQLEFEGTFHQLMTFFDELSRLARIMSVSSITIRDPRGYQEESGVAVKGACKLIAYRHLEENERIEAPLPEDQAKRGKQKPAPARKPAK